MATSLTPTSSLPAKFNDLEVAKVVFDQFFDRLVSALDPVQFSIDLISRGLLASEEAEDIAKSNWGRREKLIFLLNRMKGSANPEWFDSLLKILEAADVLKPLEEEMRQCTYIEDCVVFTEVWYYSPNLYSVPQVTTA